MKIVLDPQIFNDQKFGGISKYYSEIYKKLSSRGVSIDLPILYTENLHLKDAIGEKFTSKYQFFIKNNIFRRKFIRKVKRLNLRYANQFLLSASFDLFIPTYYNPYFIDLIGDKPFVLTVYDMIHELFPQYFSENDQTSANKKLLIEEATMIIAVSNNTKKDILRFFPDIDPDKIRVVYHGHSAESKNEVQVSLPERYILFVGNRENYKNFDFFLDSIQSLLREDKDLHLICAGGNAFRSDEKKKIAAYGLESKVIQRNFEDRELNSYYKNALCFVFPSIYEGFGIPVMESMANGCPLILTDNSCFPEVAGNAAIFFELDNADDLLAKVKTFVYNESAREDYRARGYQRVSEFTWEKAATQCFEVYQTAIAKNNTRFN